MITPFLETTQTHEGWQTAFAFQIFHRSAEEWLKMRWGFNAGALLDEALDRYKLFIESQAVDETAFLANDQPNRTLALRGMNLPGKGLQMAFLGKAAAPEKIDAQHAAQDYAREIFSIFPHDFIVQPAEHQADHNRLWGKEFFVNKPQVASIQRGMAFIPPIHGYQNLSSLWQSSPRANEQVWRALSNMQKPAMLNIVMQPSTLYESEKELLLDVAKKVLDMKKEEAGVFSSYITWADDYVKRRLAPWKRFFLLQVHILAEGAVDENLLCSIGTTVTRESNNFSSPGFRIARPNSMDEEKEWLERIGSLDLLHSPMHTDDLVDLDEAFSVFRFPLRPEAGLPGANFIQADYVSPQISGN